MRRHSNNSNELLTLEKMEKGETKFRKFRVATFNTHFDGMYRSLGTFLITAPSLADNIAEIERRFAAKRQLLVDLFKFVSSIIEEADSWDEILQCIGGANVIWTTFEGVFAFFNEPNNRLRGATRT